MLLHFLAVPVTRKISVSSSFKICTAFYTTSSRVVRQQMKDTILFSHQHHPLRSVLHFIVLVRQQMNNSILFSHQHYPLRSVLHFILRVRQQMKDNIIVSHQQAFPGEIDLVHSAAAGTMKNQCTCRACHT